MIKKMMCFIMFFVMSIAFKTGFAQAADFSDAMQISVNSDVSGSVMKGYHYEQNYYMFTIPENGYVTLNFSNPLQASSEKYWTMYLYNASFIEVYTKGIYGNKTNIISQQIGLGAGTYYVKIISADDFNAESQDIYTFRINYSVSDYWEKEFNDGYLNADEIQLNSTYYGSTLSGYKYEEDYYKFTIYNDGVVSVKFTNPLQGDTEDYWKLYLYNDAYKEIYSRNLYGNYDNINTPEIGLAAGTYYVNITSSDDYHANSTDTYSLCVNYMQSNEWEKEFNDNYLSADHIEIGSVYYGSIISGYNYESDYYQLIVNYSGNYSIDMETVFLNDSDDYWNMCLYDSSYDQIGKISVYGNETKHSIVKYLSTGTYYIKIISSDDFRAKSTDTYSIKVSSATLADVQENCSHDYSYETISSTYFSRGYVIYTCSKCGNSYVSGYKEKLKLNSPHISTSSSYVRKRKAKLVWSSVSDASGYQVRYSTKRDFKKDVKKLKVKRKTQKAIKSLKKNKKYYVQIRAYIKSGSKIAYSTWSNSVYFSTK